MFSPTCSSKKLFPSRSFVLPCAFAHCGSRVQVLASKSRVKARPFPILKRPSLTLTKQS